MLGFNGGKKLYYSTYKSKCIDRETCSSFSDVCEAPTKTRQINHLILSSEPLSGENIWIEIEPMNIVGADYNMTLFQAKL